MKAQFNIKNPVHFLALGFGSGLLKPAPGTWGTLAAIPLYLLIVYTPAAQLVAYSAIVLVSFGLGVYLCGQTAEDVGVHDHGAIVWDEIVGFLITMFMVEVTWINILLGFLLFRVFDIVKPWPIKRIDRSVHGGFGIMIDDVIAGIAACLCLHLMNSWIL